MITLRDEIEINVPPERIFDWLAHLDENYLAWHPDHVACRYLTDGPLQEGSVIYCEEYLHGDLHKLELRATEVVPNARIDYRSGSMMYGAFIIEPCAAGSRFIAELSFGVQVPLLERFLDALFRRLLSGRLRLFRQHMVEEGVNLKRILETESPVA